MASIGKWIWGISRDRNLCHDLKICPVRAGSAIGFPVYNHLSIIPHNLSASRAGRLFPGWPGKIIFTQRHMNLLDSEENVVRHSLVCLKLLCCFVIKSRGVLCDKVTAFLRGNYSIGLIRFKVNKCGGHYAVVHELKGSPAQFGSGNKCHGIGRTPIHLNVDNEILYLVKLPGVIKAYKTAAKHGHPYANHLPRTEVTVGFY